MASTLESRALSLLGSGVSAEQTAAALGCSPSRISQLLSADDFSSKVRELRFSALSAHSERDARYDSLEDKLATRLENFLPMLMKPMELVKSLQVVNSLKRRGHSSLDSIQQQQTVVSLQLPSIVVNKFVTNIQNQVIQAGGQELLTIQSSALLKEHKGEQDAKLLQLKNSVSEAPVLEYNL